MAYPRRTRPASRGAVRIPRTTARRGVLAAAVALCLLHTPHAAASSTPAAAPEEPVPTPCQVDEQAPPKRQLRAEWIAGVHNIDWPSEQGLSAEQQRAELTELYDQAQADGLNAVFVQIRPTADAFWPSPHEPWSEWLTGEQGGDPGYDPLEFAVSEAHERNLEFHGWFNPYRVAMHDDPARLTEDHPARRHPDWVFDYGGRLYYDPGVPEVRAFVVEAMMDAVENYDLDGVHFDDYFYPYPVSGEELPDQDTFAEHGGSFDDVDDWRRDNVDRLVREMDTAVHEAKPHVKFGVSPFGIWRNASSDPAGSDTSGFESYDGIYADSRRWVEQGWVDYINPQVYWEIGLPVADYAVLVPWWEEVVADTGVQLYIGQAAYKAGNDGAWSDPDELARHLEFNRDHPGVDGDVYFSAASLRTNARQAMDAVLAEHYAHPALIPIKEDLGGAAPSAPVVSRAQRGEDGTRLTIRPRSGESPAYYAVYGVDGAPDPGEAPCRIQDPRHLLGTVRADGDRPTTFTAPAHEGERTYYATALDRLHHESPPGNPRHTP